MGIFMNKIQIKRSSVADKKPLAADLLPGELAVNLQDRKLFTKTEAGTVIQIGNPETADQLSVVGAVTTGGKVISGGNVDATNAVNISGAAAEINIGTGGNSTPAINMATSPTTKHSIKANGTDLELTAPRVKVANGVLTLNPTSGKEGYIAGPLGNKMLTDDGNGHVILAASRTGTETGDVILGGKLNGHYTRNVKLASSLVNESDEVLVDATTGKIRASMLDTVYITPSGVSGSYYNKSEADSKFQTIADDASRNYSKTEVDNKLLSYPTLTAAGATFLSKTDATTNHYTKEQSDANYYSKAQADSRFFGVANNIVTDAYVLSRTVDGLVTSDTRVLSQGYSGFYRWNGLQSHKGLSVHVAHSNGANGAHARGISFDYGSSGDASGRRLWTYGYNANGEMTGMSKIYTDTDKPTAAELGVVNKTGDSMTGTLDFSNTPHATPKFTALTPINSTDDNVLRRFRSTSSAAIWHETVNNGQLKLSHGMNANDTPVKTIDIAYGTETNHGISYVSTHANGFRIAPKEAANGFFIRNDGSETYFMFTEANDQLGGWNGLRPLRMNNTTGIVTMGHGLNVSNGSISSSGTITAGSNITAGGTLRSNTGTLYMGAGSGAKSSITAYMWGNEDTGGTRRNVLEYIDDNGYMAFLQRNSDKSVSYSVNGTISSIKTQATNLRADTSIGIGVDSGLGANSICIGDNDTGFKQNGDGNLDTYANAVMTQRSTSAWQTWYTGGSINGDLHINSADLYVNGLVKSNAGGFYSKSDSNSHYWFQQADGTEKGVIYAGADKVIRYRAAGGHLFENNVQRGNSIIHSGMFQTTVPNDGSQGGIRANVPGGGWVDWQARPAGLLIDINDHTTQATNIFKVTQWGHSHRCSLDYHGTEVRLHTTWGGDFIFSGSDFVAPGELKAGGGNVRLLTDGNILAPVFDSGNLKQELNNIRAIANSKPSGDVNAWNAAYNNSVRSVRWGAVNNFGSLNQTTNQRYIDNGWFMVGLNGTGGTQNNSMNIIGGRIQVYRVESGWVDAWV